MLAVQSHSAWPTVWSTEAEMDLQNRLSRLPFYAPSASSAGLGDVQFGGVIEDVQKLLQSAPAVIQKGLVIIEKAGPHLDLILSVVEDPALPLAVDRVKVIRQLTTGTPTNAPTNAAASPGAKGVGLSKFIPALDAAIWYLKYPYAPWVAAAGAVLVIGGIGFGLGRMRRKKVAPTVTGYRRKRR